MQHYILYDSGCAQCDDIAAKLEKESGGALLGLSLYSGQAKQWLDLARPNWKFEPTLVQVDGDRVNAYTGLAMRAHMVTFLNPLQLLKIVRVVQQAGIPLLGSLEGHAANPELFERDEPHIEPEPAPAKLEIPSGFSMLRAGPEIGETTPVASVTTTRGQALSLTPNNGENTLLLFFSTSCGYCQITAQALAEYAVDAPERIILVFGAAEPEQVAEFLGKHQLQEFPIVISPETRSAFDVTGVPYGYALDQHGTVRGKGIINNNEHLDSLANTFYVSVAALKQALASRTEERVVIS